MFRVVSCKKRSRPLSIVHLQLQKMLSSIVDCPLSVAKNCKLMSIVDCELLVVGCKNKAAGLFYISFYAVWDAAAFFSNPLLDFSLFHK